MIESDVNMLDFCNIILFQYDQFSISTFTTFVTDLCKRHYFEQIETIKILEKLNQLVQFRKKFSSEDHPTTANLLGNIGNLIIETSLSTLALPFFMEQLRIETLYLGCQHPDLASLLYSIGQIYKSHGELIEAKKYFTEAFSSLDDNQRKGKLYAQISYNIGLVNYRLSLYEDATKYFNIAVKEHQVAYDEFHPTVAEIRIKIGKFQLEIGMLQDAMDNFLEALTIIRMAFGNDYSKVAECLYGIGLIHEARSEFTESLNALSQALSIEENSQDGDDRFSQLILHRICIIYQSMEENDETTDMYENVKKIIESKASDDDALLCIFRFDLDSPAAAAAA